jgi:hypothetical protein
MTHRAAFLALRAALDAACLGLFAAAVLAGSIAFGG